jgi:DMSO reductase iron-sulfur subunit
MTEKRYGMVIDTQHCVGCQTCTVSCKISNEVPGNAHWNHLESLDGEELYRSTGTFPRTTLAFRPLLCNHCEDPACVNNCPSGAMHKDTATGIVSVNQDVCIACGYCAWVCPYGAPSMDDVDHVMSKCTFCAERVAAGAEPYCVAACPANARVFGDLNDPESAPSKLMQERHAEPYLAEAGTHPSVYYI